MHCRRIALLLLLALGACSNKLAEVDPTPAVRTLKLNAEPSTPEALHRTVAVLNERLRLAEIDGKAEVRGPQRIDVTLPADEGAMQRAARLLLAGGELLFYVQVTDKEMAPAQMQTHIEEIQKQKEAGTYRRDEAPYDVALRKEDRTPVLLENPPVPGYLLSKVKATTDPKGRPAVEFEMTEAGSAEFLAFTTKHLKRTEAIVFDGTLLLSPTIAEPIEGAGIISGRLNEQEAKDMVTILKSGRLPLSLNLEAEPGGEAQPAGDGAAAAK